MEQNKILSLPRKAKNESPEKRKIVRKEGEFKRPSRHVFVPPKKEGDANSERKDLKPLKNGKKKSKSKLEFVAGERKRLVVFNPHFTIESYMQRPEIAESIRILSHFDGRFDFLNPKILSKGIRQTLQALSKERNLGVSNRRLHFALVHYSNAPTYRKIYRVGAMRYDLQGNATDKVTQEDVDFINERTLKLRKKLIIKSLKKGK